MMQDQELAALLGTVYVLAGVYAGSYLTPLWATPAKSLAAGSYVVLVSSLTGWLIWLFYQAEWYAGHPSLVNVLMIGFPLLLASITGGTLIRLFRMSVHYQLQLANTLTQHSQRELELLQSQLSPHFLFNTLNNVYGISLLEPDKIPPLLLKLSELLRYSVYETRELFVPLQSEVNYVSNYIAFEQLRMGDRLALTYRVENRFPTHLRIAPMLLIVFVENAFKHAKHTTAEQITIDINMEVSGNTLLFRINNSLGDIHSPSPALDPCSGLGLPNVQKRLELLYQNAYELVIERPEHEYRVSLRLSLA